MIDRVKQVTIEMEETPESKVLLRFAREAQALGWQALLVGGAVRDMVLGLDPKDLDVEVYGAEPDELIAFLHTFAGKDAVDVVGKSFGVIKIKVDGVDLDVSIPRRESKRGRGHKGFMVESDPALSPMEAAARRDFTMNALAFDPLTGDVLDFFDGVWDLTRRRVLRHVGPAFAEDPLRVLRGFQFCGRFDLLSPRETRHLCRDLASEADTLPVERVWAEWEKWARLSTAASKGLRFLQEVGWLPGELATLVDTPQDRRWHAEGSVWVHTLMTVNAMVNICECDDIGGEDRVALVLAALCHDLGKPATTVVHGDGHVTSHGHEAAGVDVARAFLTGIGCPAKIAERVLRLVAEHMFEQAEVTKRAVRRLARRLAPETIDRWALLKEADIYGSVRDVRVDDRLAQIGEIERVAETLKVRNAGPEPVLLGRHLIELGWTPGPVFGDVLRAAFEAQLDSEFETVEEGKAWVKDAYPFQERTECNGK